MPAGAPATVLVRGTASLSTQGLRAQVRVQVRLLRAGEEALTEAAVHDEQPNQGHRQPQNWCHIIGPVPHL